MPLSVSVAVCVPLLQFIHIYKLSFYIHIQIEYNLNSNESLRWAWSKPEGIFTHAGFIFVCTRPQKFFNQFIWLYFSTCRPNQTSALI